MSHPSQSSKLVLYGRPNCPLCEEARLVLMTAGMTFEEVDVSTDESLEKEYGTMVPIVMFKSRPIFHGGMNPSDLPGLIAGHGNGGGWRKL